MIKLIVFGDADSKSVKEVHVKLRQKGEDIVVQAVDRDGCDIHRGNLITLKSNGTYFLCGGVNKSLGFDLDEKERIREDFIMS